MELLGDWNWYFPTWLEWLPRINIEGAQADAHEAVGAAQAAPTSAAAAVAPVTEGGQDVLAEAGTPAEPVPASDAEPHPKGSPVWKWLGRIGLIIAGVLVLASAFGGAILGLAVTGGPEECGAGGGTIVISDANAESFHEKWDAFDATLDGGSPASMTLNESEINSRVHAWNEEKDIFEEIRVCIHDGYGEATGTLDGAGIVDGEFKLTGTVQLTGEHPVVDIYNIDLGNVPDPLLASLEDPAEGPIEEALQKVDLDHDYTVTYAEGEVRIDGRP